MKSPCKIAVAGAGLIGKRHADLIQAGIQDVDLAAIVDPAPAGRDYAQACGLEWYPSLTAMFAACDPDGVIIATPNQRHVENGLECVAATCPMLVEKPIASSSLEARELVDAASAAGVPLLVGHHRRHNPLIRQARALINEGRLGRIRVVQGTFWISKPDDGYFAPEWRRTAGGGPVMVNAIHDIDLLRYLCGDVARVQAISSNATRKFDVEDTAVALLTFRSGVLGTFTLSDTVASPWSWEMTSGENPDFPRTQQSCYLIGGTEGALSVPDLKLWQHPDGGHWKDPIGAVAFPSENTDPLVAQIRHFADVIRGRETPLVSGEEGLRSLQVVEAILESAATGNTVELGNGS